jgi:carbon-monoxide dehydrogenase large subunit
MADRPNRLLGSPVLRKEDPRLLLGQARYVADIKLPRMVHAAVVRSPHAHARITGIETALCDQDSRVLAVLTASDVVAVPPLPAIDAEPGAKPFLQPVLAGDKVRYVGEPVAVVVAADRYIAEDVAQLVRVDYEVLPAVVSPEAAMAEDAPLLHTDSNVADEWRFSVGESSEFTRSPHTFRATYKTQRFAGTPLETRGVIAEWEPGREKLTIYTSTQVPHFVKGIVAGYLGLPAHAVRVVAPDVGGAFGAKIQPFSEDILMAMLAMRLNRPVKWIEDRYEHFVGSNHGREQNHDLEVFYDDDGIVVGIKDHIVTNAGAYLQAFTFADAACAVLTVRGPYRIPLFEAVATTVVSNKTPLNPFRGVGMSQATFAIERAMDLIAEERGIDPVEIRLRNMLMPEELPVDRGISMTFQGSVLDSGNYPAALLRAKELIEYSEFRREQARLRERGQYTGVGFSAYVEKTALGPYESSTVSVDAAGLITVVTGAGPSGQGTETTLAQIAADELGVDMEDVRVVHGDTDLVRDGVGSYASRIAAVGGTAVRLASGKVKEKALKIAEQVLEVDASDLEWADGRVVAKGAPSRSVTLGEIAAAVAPGKPLPPGIDTYGLGETEVFHPAAEAFSFGTVAATVEVDIETGEVHPLRLVMVGDSGTIINPLLLDGQYQGGLALGVGGALLEEIVYDETGQPLNPNFMDYLMPQVDSMPEIVLDHTTTRTHLNPDGIKGAGESGAIAPAGAFANAVSDALSPFGIGVNETPISPAKVYQQLVQAGVIRTPGSDRGADQ